MTAEDLLRLPHDDRRYELVRGELVPMPPVAGEHGGVAVNLASELRDVVRPAALGWVVTETGFILTRDPDLVRAPDIAFIRRDRLTRDELAKGYVPFAPDLAVEIVSPNDSAADLVEKVQEYLHFGAQLVWLVEPRTRTVTVYRPDGSAQVLRATAGDTLSGENVIPGISLPVAEVFEF